MTAEDQEQQESIKRCLSLFRLSMTIFQSLPWARNCALNQGLKVLPACEVLSMVWQRSWRWFEAQTSLEWKLLQWALQAQRKEGWSWELGKASEKVWPLCRYYFLFFLLIPASVMLDLL